MKIPFLAWLAAALCPAFTASADPAYEQLKADILAAPDLHIVRGLDMTDSRDGLQRMNQGSNEMIRYPGPIAKDFPTDQHTLAFYRVNNLLIEDCRLQADVVAEALKFSDCRNVIVRNCTVIGGHEDALDVVRGGNLIFENVTFVARGARAATIKGGVADVYFVNCDFSGSTTTAAYIELGDWTEYDREEHPPTRNIFIDASNAFDCPTIQVRRGNGRRLRQSETTRAVRTYYTKNVQSARSTEDIPSIFMPIYFSVQDLIK